MKINIAEAEVTAALIRHMRDKGLVLDDNVQITYSVKRKGVGLTAVLETETNNVPIKVDAPKPVVEEVLLPLAGGSDPEPEVTPAMVIENVLPQDPIEEAPQPQRAKLFGG